MASKKSNDGFQASAGLMRYFDSETDKGLKISPKSVVGLAIALIVIVLVIQVFIPL